MHGEEEQDRPSSRLANAAIAYHPDSHVADRPKVMGRHSAGAGFLGGFLSHAEVDAFRFQVGSARHREHLKTQLAAVLPLRRPAEAIAFHRVDRLEAVGALQLPDPAMAEAAWIRRGRGDRAYSLCGLTHTISSVAALEAFGQLLIAPLQPWDALICTSRCVRDEVRSMLEGYAEYLGGRTGRAPPVAIRLPVIPLGVGTSRYTDDPARRASLRARIGAAEEDVVILFLGRLSFHAKANPLPLVLAAERAASRTARRLHVLFVGQFPNALQERAFKGLGGFSSNVGVHFLSGADRALVDEAWRGADVFASLSDNVQESFGLTVIEAMAAGLPVLASDWDGYRDTVRDGVTGILVPTLFAPAGVGAGLAEKHRAGRETYDHYIGAVALGTAVDVEAAGAALARLADDQALRMRMGEAGRTAARERFDWKHVVRAHQELWAELADIRRGSPGLGVRGEGEPAHPLHRDPFALFAAHPSRSMTLADRVGLDNPSELDGLFKTRLAVHGNHDLLLSEPEIRTLVERIGAGSPSVGDLAEGLDPDPLRRLLGTLTWLAKFGVVRVEASPEAPAGAQDG